MARGASYLLLQTISTSAISLLAFAVIARSITRQDMGGLAVLQLVATAASLFASLGVGSTATRFVASFESKGEFENMRKAGYECVIINATMTVAVTLVTVLAANWLALLLFGSALNGNLFRLLGWEIAAVSIYTSFTNVLVGLKRFKELSLASIASFAVRQTSVVAMLVLGLGLPGILIGWGIGDSLNALLLGGFTKKFLGPFGIGFGFRKLLKFSAPLFFGQAASYAWTWFDRALLLPLVTLSQLGAYNVSVTAYGILSSVPTALSSALFPYYSHFYGDGKSASGTQNLEDAVEKASRYVSFITIPLAVGLGVTALPAATLLAGGNYVDAAYPLAVLSIFLAIACLTSALGQIFVVLGKTVTSAVITVASVLLPILMGFLMISHFGIIGASVARGVSLIISLALSVLILKMAVKVRFDLTAYRDAWLASLVMAGVVLGFEAAFYHIYLLPLYILTGAISFTFSLRFLHAIKAEDLELISHFLSPRLRFVTRWLGSLLDVKPNHD